MSTDLRVCFLGDSYVAGVGDPEHLGWVGRVAVRHSQQAGPLTAYNLGVRGETSQDVRGRWRLECAPRFSREWDCRMVVSFGVNDTTDREGRRRVGREHSIAHLSALLSDVIEAGWPILVVGPPPIADDVQNSLVGELDGDFERVCAARAVPYVGVFPTLLGDATWMAEVERGDGAHPAASGYRVLGDLVWHTWQSWLA